MENNRIKESISAVNQSLGIDLEVIVNDAQLESQKKFKLTYEKVLSNGCGTIQKVNSAYRRTSV